MGLILILFLSTDELFKITFKIFTKLKKQMQICEYFKWKIKIFLAKIIYNSKLKYCLRCRKGFLA